MKQLDVPLTFTQSTLDMLPDQLKHFIISQKNAFYINHFVYYEVHEVIVNEKVVIKVCELSKPAIDTRFVWYWHVDNQEFELYLHAYSSNSTGLGPLTVAHDVSTLLHKCSTLTMDDMWALVQTVI